MDILRPQPAAPLAFAHSMLSGEVVVDSPLRTFPRTSPTSESLPEAPNESRQRGNIQPFSAVGEPLISFIDAVSDAVSKPCEEHGWCQEDHVVAARLQIQLPESCVLVKMMSEREGQICELLNDTVLVDLEDDRSWAAHDLLKELLFHDETCVQHLLEFLKEPRAEDADNISAFCPRKATSASQLLPQRANSTKACGGGLACSGSGAFAKVCSVLDGVAETLKAGHKAGVRTAKVEGQTCNVLMVLDSSGSMVGCSLKGAQEGTVSALTALGDGERVDLMTFNTQLANLSTECEAIDTKTNADVAKAAQEVKAGGRSTVHVVLLESSVGLAEDLDVVVTISCLRGACLGTDERCWSKRWAKPASDDGESKSEIQKASDECHCCDGKAYGEPLDGMLLQLCARNAHLTHIFKADTFTSKTKGPRLKALWGQGDLDPVRGSIFAAGKGLAVEHDRCLKDPADTVDIEASLNDVSTWSWLIDSDGCGDPGFYVDAQFQFQSFPSADAIKCAEELVPNKVHHFVVTRDDQGVVSLDLNGWQCGTGKLPYASGHALDPAGVWCFKDTRSQETGGVVRKMMVWDKAVPDAEVRVEWIGSLHAASKVCEHHHVLSPDFLEHGSCSVWNREAPGVGFGHGHLTSPMTWTAGAAKSGELMMMDIGGVLSVAGVVSQGRNDDLQRLKTFEVQGSNDRLAWKQVQCGRSLSGNTEQHTTVRTLFEPAVKARDVGIVAQNWQWHVFPSLRAAVLICELRDRQCVGAELDFRFQNNLVSRTKGHGLQTLWGDGNLVSSSECWIENGQGFAVEEGRCSPGPAYTICIKAKLDVIAGLRRIIGSDGGGESGIYVNKQAQTLPESSNLKCSDQIRPNTYFQFVVSRSGCSVYRLSLNGSKCAKESPGYESACKLSPALVAFFHDENGQSTASYVKRIHMWDEAKKEADGGATLCGCTLAEIDDACTDVIKCNAMHRQIKYSSVWANEQSGVDHGRGRLSSPQGWSAGTKRVSELMQLDTGEVQSIAGVVVQGRREACVKQRITSVRFKISKDGSGWLDVDSNRVFDATTDLTTKLEVLFGGPLKGQCIRIYPETWVNHMSMRAGVLNCERPCENRELDFTLQETFASETEGPSLDACWGAGTLDAVNGDRFLAGQSFQLEEFNCIPGPAYTIYLTVLLEQTSACRRVINSDGRGDSGLYTNDRVPTFPLGNQLKCNEEIRVGLFYQYVLIRTDDGEVSLDLNGYPCGRSKVPYQDEYKLDEHGVEFLKDDGTEEASGSLKRIKLWDHALTDGEVVSECGCVLTTAADKCDKCDSSYTPDNAHFDYSCVWSNDPKGQVHLRGRLKSPQAWSACSNKMDQSWIMDTTGNVGRDLLLDTGEKEIITGGVATGLAEHVQCVTAYKIQVSDDKGSWNDIECGRVLDGNTDQPTAIETKLDKTLEARYVKIIPQGWHGHLSLRAAVLVCEKECKNGKINYKFEGELSSASFGPMLKAEWGDGKFDPANRWHKLGDGQGLQLDESACIGPETWSSLIHAKLDEVEGLRQVLGSWAWDEDGFYVDRQLQLLPETDKMVCTENLQTCKCYHFGITCSPSGAISMYMSGNLCGTAEVAAHEAVFIRAPKLSASYHTGICTPRRLVDHDSATVPHADKAGDAALLLTVQVMKVARMQHVTLWPSLGSTIAVTFQTKAPLCERLCTPWISSSRATGHRAPAEWIRVTAVTDCDPCTTTLKAFRDASTSLVPFRVLMKTTASHWFNLELEIVNKRCLQAAPSVVMDINDMCFAQADLAPAPLNVCYAPPMPLEIMGGPCSASAVSTAIVTAANISQHTSRHAGNATIFVALAVSVSLAHLEEEQTLLTLHSWLLVGLSPGAVQLDSADAGRFEHPTWGTSSAASWEPIANMVAHDVVEQTDIAACQCVSAVCSFTAANAVDVQSRDSPMALQAAAAMPLPRMAARGVSCCLTVGDIIDPRVGDIIDIDPLALDDIIDPRAQDVRHTLPLDLSEPCGVDLVPCQPKALNCMLKTIRQPTLRLCASVNTQKVTLVEANKRMGSVCATSTITACCYMRLGKADRACVESLQDTNNAEAGSDGEKAQLLVAAEGLSSGGDMMINVGGCAVPVEPQSVCPDEKDHSCAQPEELRHGQGQLDTSGTTRAEDEVEPHSESCLTALPSSTIAVQFPSSSPVRATLLYLAVQRPSSVRQLKLQLAERCASLDCASIFLSYAGRILYDDDLLPWSCYDALPGLELGVRLRGGGNMFCSGGRGSTASNQPGEQQEKTSTGSPTQAWKPSVDASEAEMVLDVMSGLDKHTNTFRYGNSEGSLFRDVLNRITAGVSGEPPREAMVAAARVLRASARHPAQLMCRRRDRGYHEGEGPCCFAHIVSGTAPSKWVDACNALTERLVQRLAEKPANDLDPEDVIIMMKQAAGKDACGDSEFSKAMKWLEVTLPLVNAGLRDQVDGWVCDVCDAAKAYARVHKMRRRFWPVQLAAILLYVRGFLSGQILLGQMQTGEGKTDVCAAIAGVLVKQLQKTNPNAAVHIITSSSDRASADCSSTRDFYLEFLGEPPTLASETLRWGPGGGGVVYAQITVIQRTVLNEQIHATPERQQDMDDWFGTCFAMIDECDLVLIEQATNQLYMSGPCPSFQALDPVIFSCQWHVDHEADFSHSEVPCRQAVQGKAGALNAKVMKKIRTFERTLSSGANDGCGRPSLVPHKLHLEASVERLCHAALSAGLKQEENEFLITEEVKDCMTRLKVMIMDPSNGTECVGCRWTHEGPFIEFRQRIPIEGIEPLAYFNSVVAAVKRYKLFSGITGTLGQEHCREFFEKVYGKGGNLTMFRFPRNRISCLFQLEPMIASTEDEWMSNVATAVEKYMQGTLSVRGPILIIADTVQMCKRLVEALGNKHGHKIMERVEAQPRPGETDSEPTEETESALGQPSQPDAAAALDMASLGTEGGWRTRNKESARSDGCHVFQYYLGGHVLPDFAPDCAVFVASNKGGRGLDIKLDGTCPSPDSEPCCVCQVSNCAQSGSVLFVMITTVLSDRQDKQAVGRCGRCSKPGIFQYQICRSNAAGTTNQSEDDLPQDVIMIKQQLKKLRVERGTLQERCNAIREAEISNRVMRAFAFWKSSYVASWCSELFTGLELPHHGSVLGGVKEFLAMVVEDRWKCWRDCGPDERRPEDDLKQFRVHQVLSDVTADVFSKTDPPNVSDLQLFESRLWALTRFLMLDSEILLDLGQRLLRFGAHDHFFKVLASSVLKEASAPRDRLLKECKPVQPEWTATASLLRACLATQFGQQEAATKALDDAVCRLDEQINCYTKFLDVTKFTPTWSPGVQVAERVEQLRHRIGQLRIAQTWISEGQTLKAQHFSQLTSPDMTVAFYCLGELWAKTVFAWNIVGLVLLREPARMNERFQKSLGPGTGAGGTDSHCFGFGGGGGTDQKIEMQSNQYQLAQAVAEQLNNAGNHSRTQGSIPLIQDWSTQTVGELGLSSVRRTVTEESSGVESSTSESAQRSHTDSESAAPTEEGLVAFLDGLARKCRKKREATAEGLQGQEYDIALTRTFAEDAAEDIEAFAQIAYHKAPQARPASSGSLPVDFTGRVKHGGELTKEARDWNSIMQEAKKLSNECFEVRNESLGEADQYLNAHALFRMFSLAKSTECDSDLQDSMEHFQRAVSHWNARLQAAKDKGNTADWTEEQASNLNKLYLRLQGRARKYMDRAERKGAARIVGDWKPTLDNWKALNTQSSRLWWLCPPAWPYKVYEACRGWRYNKAKEDVQRFLKYGDSDCFNQEKMGDFGSMVLLDGVAHKDGVDRQRLRRRKALARAEQGGWFKYFLGFLDPSIKCSLDTSLSDEELAAMSREQLAEEEKFQQKQDRRNQDYYDQHQKRMQRLSWTVIICSIIMCLCGLINALFLAASLCLIELGLAITALVSSVASAILEACRNTVDASPNYTQQQKEAMKSVLSSIGSVISIVSTIATLGVRGFAVAAKDAVSKCVKNVQFLTHSFQKLVSLPSLFQKIDRWMGAFGLNGGRMEQGAGDWQSDLAARLDYLSDVCPAAVTVKQPLQSLFSSSSNPSAAPQPVGKNDGAEGRKDMKNHKLKSAVPSRPDGTASINASGPTRWKWRLPAGASRKFWLHFFSSVLFILTVLGLFGLKDVLKSDSTTLEGEMPRVVAETEGIRGSREALDGDFTAWAAHIRSQLEELAARNEKLQAQIDSDVTDGSQSVGKNDGAKVRKNDGAKVVKNDDSRFTFGGDVIIKGQRLNVFTEAGLSLATLNVFTEAGLSLATLSFVAQGTQLTCGVTTKDFNAGSQSGGGDGYQGSESDVRTVSWSYSYKIKSGDYLSVIADRLGVSVKVLLALNPTIKNANQIRAGDIISVPAPSQLQLKRHEDELHNILPSELTMLQGELDRFFTDIEGIEAQYGSLPAYCLYIWRKRKELTAKIEKLRAEFDFYVSVVPLATLESHPTIENGKNKQSDNQNQNHPDEMEQITGYLWEYLKSVEDADEKYRKGDTWYPYGSPEKDLTYTIGYGHKLPLGGEKKYANGVSHEEVEKWLREDMHKAVHSAKFILGDEVWNKLSAKGKAAVADYAFNCKDFYQDDEKSWPNFKIAVREKNLQLLLEHYKRHNIFTIEVDGVPVLVKSPLVDRNQKFKATFLNNPDDLFV